MSSRSPSLAQVFGAYLAAALRNIHTVCVGEVQSYDAQTQTARISPIILPAVTGEDGVIDYPPLPDLINVPVLFAGSGTFRHLTPVAQGDLALVFFLENRRDNWQGQNGSGQVKADSTRRFHIADGVALMLGKFWEGYDAAKASSGKDGGPQVVYTDSTIELGGDAANAPTEGALLATTFRQKQKDLHNTLGQHLAAMSAAIGSAGAAITAFATAVNALGAAPAVPVVGGAIGALAAPLQPAGGFLQTAQSEAQQAAQALTQFELEASGRNDDVSQIVKLK